MQDSLDYTEALRFICEKLDERTATLFLGAGLNNGLTNDDNEAFPLGRDLAHWIARDLLQAHTG